MWIMWKTPNLINNKVSDSAAVNYVRSMIKYLDEKYPSNKGRVYISNIAAFIKMSNNKNYAQ